MKETDLWPRIEERLALWGFGMLAVALPFSNLFMSLGLFTAAGGAASRIVRTIIFRRKVTLAQRHIIIILPILIWLMTLCGGIGSDDKSHWLWDVRVKLPLFLLPLFALFFQDMLKRNFRIIVGLYIAGVTTACVICLWVVLTGNYSEGDVRSASIFISHIRFGLMMALVLPLLYFSPLRKDGRNHLILILFFSLSALFLSFEVITANVTGLVVTAAVLLFISGHYSFHHTNKLARCFLVGVMLLIVSTFLYVRSEYVRYFSPLPGELLAMEERSLDGENYLECVPPMIVEEGRITGRYIAPNELDSAWYSRTRINLSTLDDRRQPLKFTLIRYLTSLELRKDAAGVMQLSDDDVQQILAGHTSVHEGRRSAISNRMYALFYEWSVYKETGIVSGHSLFQRFEFWRAAWNIIRQSVWFGVGPGDIPKAFENSYNEIKSSLDHSHRLRAHNQFLSLWISFGISGLMLLIAVLLLPMFQLRWPLMTSFILISFLSFITEDTLETQAGVCFFAFFFSFLSAVRSE